MSSEIPRHSRALYSPAGEYPSSNQPTPPPQTRPRWSRTHSIASNSSRRRRSKLSSAKRNAKRVHKWARRKLGAMTMAQKILGGVLLAIGLVMGILMLVFHKQILHELMEPAAVKLRSWKAGWLLIFLLCFVSAFPPMIGYSTSVTLAGFVYGFPNGWFIIASATIIGATAAFMASRYFFRSFAKRMVATDRRFAALALTLKHDGVKLLCMIRLCPLPYSISNGALSTFPTVSPWAFMAATALASPKLLIHVWIGARLAVLAEADEKMDPKTKALNYCSIIGGIILGIGTGWIIYKRTLKRAHQLELEERAKLAAARRRSGDPPYGDDDDETWRDPEAAEAAGLITGLIEGDELDASGLFADLEEDEEAGDAEGILLGDETSDTDNEGLVQLVEREGSELSGGVKKPQQPPSGSGPLLL